MAMLTSGKSVFSFPAQLVTLSGYPPGWTTLAWFSASGAKCIINARNQGGLRDGWLYDAVVLPFADAAQCGIALRPHNGRKMK
jgi:hypothetical protein